ncbi:DUF6879 family protein [Streptomyces alkaliterrae]|uniref:DUF6879 domain-containing protein n=1 Tax=Streptomyces alkaliterrae TaxID=2213162 RepID=A0A5P0YL47_9ACTN|nr:DUF6879 family protein [Streptomyces alkaliterrae]MBB1252715.1 hypothetical protein [Streptomyces alkaliterrae]MBB1259516.1 hypothetical protein [Streptomyces alkaliterrae]MQS00951.1 hypothetical protein [Streptomyces alkaliterrae]
MGSSKSLSDLFDSFEREAFRLETLDDYSKSGSVEAYEAFLAGEGKPEGYNADWVSEVSGHVSEGKRIYRVHILSRPLTPYLRFELSWGYRTNMLGGEEFFILDTTEQPNPLEGVEDFWLFDDTAVGVLRYDNAGTFLEAEVLPDAQAAEFIAHRDTALDHAQPFTEWWDKYGGK